MEQTPPKIFSRSKSSAKWNRARTRFRPGDVEYPFLLAEIVDDVLERLQFMRLEPASALVIGDWTGQLAGHLEHEGWRVTGAGLGEFDEEVPYSASDYALIIHVLGLGHVNDLPGALLHARMALVPGGIFLASFPGAGSLTALRQIMLAADGDRAAPRCHPLVDRQASAALLQRAGFTRQVVDSITISASYPDLTRLVSDLRDHGLSNSLAVAAPPLTKAALRRAEDQFEALADQTGRITEIFEILTLTGWK